MDTFEIECGSCGELLEVDESMAGKKVRCPHCEAVIQLPGLEDLAEEDEGDEEEEDVLAADEEGDVEEAEEEEDIPEVEAVEPEAKPRKRKAPARRGERKPEAGPRGKKAGRRGSRKGGGGAKGRSPARGGSPAKSKTPLILGAAGGLVAVIVIVAVALSLGGSGTSSGGGGSAGEDGDGNAPAAGDAGEGGSGSGGTGETGDVSSGGDGGSSPGKYRTYEIPGDVSELSLEKALPAALVKANGKSVASDRYRELKEIERSYKAEVLGELDRRRNDPFYGAVHQVKTAFLKRPGLDKFQFAEKREQPYVVFEHIGEAGEAEADPDAVSERKLKQKLSMLQKLHTRMKRMWMDPFGLSLDPALPLIIIALKDRRAFNQLNRDLKVNVPPGGLAYFSRIHTYIILYNGALGSNSLQDIADSHGVLLHEGTHQILNAYVNKGRGFNSQNYVHIPFWVNEGLAEYNGSVRITGEVDENGFDVLEMGVPNRRRLAEFYAARHPPSVSGIPPYYLDLWDLIECFDQTAIIELVKKKVGDEVKAHDANSRAWAKLQIIAVSMIYAEASSFFLFCYEYQNGTYADEIDRYLDSVFHGRHHSRFFREAFAGVDLKTLNKEWLDYVDSVTPERIKNRHR